MLSLIERTVPKDAVHAADMVYAQAYMPTKAAPGYAPYTNAWARKDEVMLEVLHKAQVRTRFESQKQGKTTPLQCYT
jgi:hypothetical protein